jgi:hypothetical protein
MGATTYDLRQPVLRARNMAGPAKVSKRHFIRNSKNKMRDWEFQKGLFLYHVLGRSHVGEVE